MRTATTHNIATVEDVLANLGAVQGATVNQRLAVLFDRFYLAARAIDPTISGAYVCRDAGEDKMFDRPVAITLRRGQPEDRT